MAKKVLVTGATGNIGGELVRRLAERGDVEVRALVRDEEKAKRLTAGGVEVALGSFEDQRSLQAAAQGVDTVALITATNPHAADQVHVALDAARQAGVRKIMRISALKADVDGPTGNTREHGHADHAIEASGLTYAILRPHFFMQNMFMSAQTIAADGVMYWGMGDGKLGMIDVRDIVDCAEQAVLSDEFDGQVSAITGPASISFYDVAGILSDLLGRPVQYVPVPLEAVEQSLLDMHAGEWLAKVMRDYSGAYSQGWGDYTTDTVMRMTGRPPRSFETFAREVFVPALQYMSQSPS